MAHRMSASVSPVQAADRHATIKPPASPAARPAAQALDILGSGTPPRGHLPPLRPGVDPNDLAAAMNMTLGVLKDRARELGVVEQRIQSVDDTDDAKAAAIDLVMRATKEAGEVGELARRQQDQTSTPLRSVSKAMLASVKQAHHKQVFDRQSRAGAYVRGVADGGVVIKGYDTNGDGTIDALDTDGDGLIDTMVENPGTLQELKNELQEIRSRVIHVGGLGDGTHENEKKLTEVFSKFGTVVACTLQRRREVEDGQKKVSWALISFDTEDEAAAAVDGTDGLEIDGLVTRPLDMEMALASTGHMGRLAALHVSKTEKTRNMRKRHRLLHRFEAVEKFHPDGTKVHFDHKSWAPPPRETAVIFEKTVIDLRHTIGASEFYRHLPLSHANCSAF